MFKALTTISMLVLLVGCAPHNAPPLELLGKWHQVKGGETVDQVAKRYESDPDVVAELNGIPREGEITGVTEIFVPTKGGEPPGDGSGPPKVAKPTADDGTGSSPPTGYCGTGGRPCFRWPVDVQVARAFGPDKGSHHDGIDLAAPEGTPIKAADDGLVLYSGDAIKGYGNLILIRHQDDIISVYAHNSENAVSEGQKVKGGDLVGKVGQSGSASAPHLHFEIRKKERPVDPLGYLPERE